MSQTAGINVLIVEDELIVATDLQESLEQEGYTIAGLAADGAGAIEILRSTEVDLVLLDINIKGDWDGIETARRLNQIKRLPFIFLTAYADKATFDRAKATRPAAYLLKPFYLPSLRMAIELAFDNFQHQVAAAGPANLVAIEDKEIDGKDFMLRLEDSIFIRQGGRHIKVKLNEIIYLEADSNHVHIHTALNQYILRRSLQSLLDELGESTLIRVHRSYAVNASMIEKITGNQIYIRQLQLPLGRNFKEAFMEKFKTL